ncbi:MAG: Fe-S-containing hydro-lyase [Treponema sp.]|jgi:fumarate hydratase subunit beta|nr:Fe-S-containing hydro-lyase [Treponema sp.]
MDIRITTPMTKKEAASLHAGDTVLISGTLYTARDAAHARLVALLEKGEPLPFDIEGAFIYYVGPTPAKPGKVIGSAGPTTSYRMDAYTPSLIALGLRGMIGKGKRSTAVIESMKKHKAIYFGAIGGAAALISRCIIAAEVVCYEDLGAEAIRKLTVKDFPATVVIDTLGNNLYTIGVEKYLSAK